ncbi:hypothetical protein [Rheinheimera sp.]|uniref:hypothetical protein n=1 Tax=Rheinheimera sp. TaxID=1869214 RepID=UPI0027336143|nr:hypothetical protein [Rheinheimera sp.]MDP2715140.1 hypothetical protein [Rheinheimera sp.]
MSGKPAPAGNPVVSQVLISILCCGYWAGCTAIELEPISYREAVAEYRSSGGNENYRCVLLPADEHYQAMTKTSPIAVEIDQVLYIKIAGSLHTLQQSDIDNSGTRYAADNISATLTIISQFNFTEYSESDDRHVDLSLQAGGKERLYKTFGTACGI